MKPSKHSWFIWIPISCTRIGISILAILRQWEQSFLNKKCLRSTASGKKLPSKVSRWIILKSKQFFASCLRQSSDIGPGTRVISRFWSCLQFWAIMPIPLLVTEQFLKFRELNSGQLSAMATIDLSVICVFLKLRTFIPTQLLAITVIDASDTWTFV